ncbi:M50 family metallopeptidase [Qipengyuania sp. DGS5-3]|uniref:M50 family metallopeptidase n=1 Tax=Qipengyuania sp. DGS5-3 TaxID=3349632 RepID=UPI0036D2AFF8
MVAPGSQAEQVGRLILAGFLVIALPSLPLGNYLIYPFTILTTWFHEMGHGLTAMALGFDFQRLVILSNGSGYAESLYPGDPGALKRAAVAAGGPLAPAVFGSLLILASARRKFWRPALYALAGLLILSVVIWVRSWTGLSVLPLVALALLAIAQRASNYWTRFTLQFLGVLGALSMFQQWDYLFTEQARIGGQTMLSDTGAIEASLLLPHWFWALAIIALAGLMIGASLKYALSHQR